MQSIADPKTGESYEYNILSETSYQLCALFETDTASSAYQEKPRIFSEQIWDHGIGRACFTLEVRALTTADGPIPFPRPAIPAN